MRLLARYVLQPFVKEHSPGAYTRSQPTYNSGSHITDELITNAHFA